MSRLRLQISVSLDGFVAGPHQSADNPLGEGGMRLHDWVFGLRSWRAAHGMEGGEEDSANDQIVAESTTNVGATIMGRNMFGPVRGAWGASPTWDGWWGPN